MYNNIIGGDKMKFKLVDNAVDSLTTFIEFYRKKTKGTKEYNKYLKLSIMMLHNSIELLIKSILVKENELIIYKDLKDDAIIDALKQKKKHQKIEDYLIRSEKVKTIDYQTCVEYYCKLYDIDNKYKNVLNNLGYLRNSIMHLGIDKSCGSQYYEIYNTIYETINVITNIMYPLLPPLHKAFKYNYISDFLDDFLEIARANEWEMFTEKNERFIYNIDIMLKDIFDSKSFNDFLKINNLRIEYETYDIDNLNIMINILDNKNQIIEEFYSDLSFYNNIILFGTDWGGINILISLNENNIYLYNKEVKFEIDEELNQFWKSDLSNQKCIRKKFNKSNLEEFMISKIKDSLEYVNNKHNDDSGQN